MWFLYSTFLSNFRTVCKFNSGKNLLHDRKSEIPRGQALGIFFVCESIYYYRKITDKYKRWKTTYWGYSWKEFFSLLCAWVYMWSEQINGQWLPIITAACQQWEERGQIILPDVVFLTSLMDIYIPTLVFL